MAGCAALSQSDLRHLRVPTDYSLEIIEGHFSLIAAWSRPSRYSDDSYGPTYGARSGPNVTDALRMTYEPLAEATPIAWMNFYKALRDKLHLFNIVMMPFEGTVIEYEAHGICYPGLSLRRYRIMGQALLQVLAQVLPKHIRLVSEQLKRAQNAREHGFDLIWALQKRLCPHFDMTKHTPWPSNAMEGDIHDYATSVQMHCDLARHRGTHYSPKQQSELFLKNITDEKYRSLANGLLLLLSDKPANVSAPFRIPALLDRLVDTSAAGILEEMDLPSRSPSANLLTGSLPVEAPAVDDDRVSPNDEYATTHVQGFVNRLTSDRNTHRGKSDRGKQDRGNSDD